MKAFPVLSFFYLILSLSSCNPYQYVSPLPSTPQFTEAREVQGQIAIGINHYEMQGSASLSKNFGVSFNTYKGLSPSNSAIRSYTLHYFRQGKRWPNLFVTGFMGYDKGKLQNDESYTLFGGLDYKIICNSDYETFRAGGGFYADRKEKRVQYGLSVNFQQIQFYRLDAKFEPLHSAPYKTYSLQNTQRYYLASPNLSVTFFSKDRIFFMRNHLLFEVPLSKHLTTTFKHSNNQYPQTAYTKPLMSPFCISIAVGMRIQTSMFKNIKRR